MKKLTVSTLALLFLLSAHWPTAAAQEDYRVVVNPDNPADTITKKQLSLLLLKKQSRWDDGTVADPVDQEGASPVREAFSKDVHGRSVSSVKNYWTQQIFSGRGKPPPEVTSDAAVVDFVSSHPGAVGYVSPRASLDNVKVITVSDG